MNSSFGGEGWSFIDILSILSFIIGLQNLELNEKQVKRLDKHLKEQDDNLLSKIIEQNNVIIQQNEQLINLFNEVNKK